MALHILVDRHNVIRWQLVLNNMWAPLTHYYLESSEWVASMEAHPCGLGTCPNFATPQFFLSHWGGEVVNQAAVRKAKTWLPPCKPPCRLQNAIKPHVVFCPNAINTLWKFYYYIQIFIFYFLLLQSRSSKATWAVESMPCANPIGATCL
jgi:hypothetical protein